MIKIRQATLKDIEQIQKIEKEYYEGYNIPKQTLKSWISELSDNFLVAEKEDKIIGMIFFEYLITAKSLPFIHELEHNKNGKYVYISEIGALSDEKDILQQLLDEMIGRVKKDNCQKILWLTGEHLKDDKIEIEFLVKNGFEKGENVKQWEAYPGLFLDDHSVWEKTI